MIPVAMKPEPSDFASTVEKKGKAFLEKEPPPRRRKDWEGQEHWKRALPHLVNAYDGVCAYCALWIPFVAGTPTVDHFVPLSVDPSLAYKWNNFRLSALLMNSRKSDHQDVLDPFLIIHECFTINFSSFMILPNTSLPTSGKAESTINRLKLNDELNISSRRAWFENYKQSQYTFAHLQKMAPFIAYEVERQGLKAPS